METRDSAAWGDPSPWIPITDTKQLKVLGKLGEETCELGTSIFRCIIQGVDEAQPVTKKVNRDWLTDEIADVLANIQLVKEHYQLDDDVIGLRIKAKLKHLRAWLEMV